MYLATAVVKNCTQVAGTHFPARLVPRYISSRIEATGMAGSGGGGGGGAEGEARGLRNGIPHFMFYAIDQLAGLSYGAARPRDKVR